MGEKIRTIEREKIREVRKHAGTKKIQTDEMGMLNILLDKKTEEKVLVVNNIPLIYVQVRNLSIKE